MPLMNAVQVAGPGADLAMVQTEIPEPGEREVLIKVEACGVCHGDAIPSRAASRASRIRGCPGTRWWAWSASWGRRRRAGTPGPASASAGAAATAWAAKPAWKATIRAARTRWITGLSVDGGYAEYMVARDFGAGEHPGRAVVGGRGAAALRGRHDLQRAEGQRRSGGDIVAVHGIGGLGHLAHPVRQPARLHAPSPCRAGREKEALARELGAHDYIDTEATDAAEELQAARRREGHPLHRPERGGDRRARRTASARAGSSSSWPALSEPLQRLSRAALPRRPLDQGLARPAAGRRDRRSACASASCR